MNINISVAKDSEFKEYYAIRCEKSNIYWSGYHNPPDYDIINMTYRQCPDKSCWTLSENYFAGCGRMIAYLELKNENTTGSNIIDLKKIKNEGKKFIDEFQRFEEWYNTKASELCGYCKISDDLIPAAIQMSLEEIKNEKNKRS